MVEEVPKAIRSDTVNILGFSLEVSVLDDGRRIINADDMAHFFEYLSSGNINENMADDLLNALADLSPAILPPEGGS